MDWFFRLKESFLSYKYMISKKTPDFSINIQTFFDSLFPDFKCAEIIDKWLQVSYISIEVSPQTWFQ